MDDYSILAVYDDKVFLFAGRLDAISRILGLRKEAIERVRAEAENGCDLHFNGKPWAFPTPEVTVKYHAPRPSGPRRSHWRNHNYYLASDQDRFRRPNSRDTELDLSFRTPFERVKARGAVTSSSHEHSRSHGRGKLGSEEETCYDETQ